MALEVSAAIIGILAAAGKVAETLGPVVSAFVDAPKHSQTILIEVRYTRTILLGLQTLFDELCIVPRRRKELIQIDQLIAALTDGVLLFSKLEALVDRLGDPKDALLSRARWARKDHEVDSLVSRLLGFKTSVALMLGILRCESDLVAQFDRQELLSNTAKILKNNLELSQRLEHLEDYFDTNHSVVTRRPMSHISTHTNQNDAGFIGLVEDNTGPTWTQSEPARAFPFERVLKASRVYRRAKRDTTDFSFCSSIPLSHAWSALSDISLSDISIISVVALPLCQTDVSNDRHYTFKDVNTESTQTLQPQGEERFESLYGTTKPEFPWSPTRTSAASILMSPPWAKVKFQRSTSFKLIIKGALEAGIDELFGKDYNRECSNLYFSEYKHDLEIDNLNIHLDIEVIHDFPEGLHIGLNSDLYHYGDLFMFMYSAASRESFELIQQHPQDVHKYQQTEDVPIMVVANHSHASLQRAVSPEEGSSFASNTHSSFCVVSEATPDFLRDAFVHLVMTKWASDSKKYFSTYEQRPLPPKRTFGVLKRRGPTTLKKPRADKSLDTIQEI